MWLEAFLRKYHLPGLKPIIAGKPSPFKVGDWAVLRRHIKDHPTLVDGKAYEVHEIAGTYYLGVRDEKGEKLYAISGHFDNLGYNPDPPGAREYDEIMQIQELMEAADGQN